MFGLQIYGIANSLSAPSTTTNTSISRINSFVERIKENVLNSGTNNNNNHTTATAVTTNKENMKWSSSSSSLSSASDRRSVFYADRETVLNEKVTNSITKSLHPPPPPSSTTKSTSDTETTNLKTTDANLAMQVRKCENLIAFFTNQIKSLTAELKTEKAWRAKQLTKIVKALLCFEAKLKNDQKLIRQQLYEKDTVINRLSQEIIVLREKCGEQNIDATTMLDVCKVAQYCPACRKEYYLNETKNVGTQVYYKHSAIASEADKSCRTPATDGKECLSSSEERIVRTPSFAEARRSKKYMSKRTSGTFRDYLRSRSNEPSSSSSTAAHHHKTESTYRRRTTTADADDDAEDDYDYEYDDNSGQENGQRENEQDFDQHQYHTTKELLRLAHRNNSMRSSSTYSTFINNMHGLKTASCTEEDDDGVVGCGRNSVVIVDEESAPEIEHNADARSRNENMNNDKRIRRNTSSCNNYRDLNANKNDEIEDDNDDEDDDVFNNGTDNNLNSSNNSFLKKYADEESHMKTNSQFETTDDWYASASDMDDSDNALSKTYGQNAVNPVLECVNQILLQQSIDGIIASSPSPDANEPQPKEPNSRQKRVHFSTQNSMVHVPRSSALSSSSFPSTLSTNEIVNEKDHQHQSNFSYESVYSNEYEPIGGGSEHNSSSSHYVDLELKSDSDSAHQHKSVTQKTKHPPALPPKPANLMKLRQALRITSGKLPSPTKSLLTAGSNSPTHIDNESEPDYCSISEVSETIKKFEIVADVHKNADAMSTASEDTRTEMTDEIFADIPKLPNVAAILSPKKDLSKFIISQDNYITKSPVGLKSSTSSLNSDHDHHVKQQIPFILAELSNKKILAPAPIRLSSGNAIKMQPIAESRPMLPTVPPPSLLPKVTDDKMPMHAEFDWYNLDVEYGKLNGSDMVKMNNVLLQNGVNRVDEEMDENAENMMIGVEYNLDQEFGDSVNHGNNSSDEDNNEPMSIGNIMDMELTQPQQTEAVNGLRFNQIEIVDTPKKKTFESFLDDTGLTTKPLPRKRKIYYSAPFV